MARPQQTAKKRLVVVDDHPIVRRGVVQIIEGEADLTVVGTAEDSKGAMAVIEECSPDAVVTDITLKGSSGIDMIREIAARWPKLPVIVFSMHDESFYAERVLRAGARGYVTKGDPSQKLIDGIHRVMTGEVYVSDKVAAKMLQGMVEGPRQTGGFPIDSLSDREFEVFGLIGEGLQTRDVAGKLKLSIKTVESHRENIKRKLGIENATELLQRAIHWVRFERGT
ncbi:MAG: response regulator [Phycisphaerae bacterium]